MAQQLDIKKVIDSLNARGVSRYTCSFCGGTHFSIQDKAATILLTSVIGNIELKNHIPTLVISCNRCGHLDFLSLLQLEALEKE